MLLAEDARWELTPPQVQIQLHQLAAPDCRTRYEERQPDCQSVGDEKETLSTRSRKRIFTNPDRSFCLFLGSQSAESDCMTVSATLRWETREALTYVLALLVLCHLGLEQAGQKLGIKTSSCPVL